MDIKLTDLIYHQEKFLTDDECDYLINESNTRKFEYELEHCPEATSGIDTYSTFKKVELKIGTEGWQIVHNATEKMINQYHEYLDSFDAFHIAYREALLFSHQYRLLKYETGTKIHQHIDHDAFIYGSCTFNLNEDYEGGEFAWFRGKHKLKLGRGDALIFPADFFWVHEVLPITKGIRYSTNSFLLQIPDYVRWEIKNLTNGLNDSSYDNQFYKQQFSAKYDIKQP